MRATPSLPEPRGFAALAAIGILVLLSIFGLAVVSLVTTTQTVLTDQVGYDQAAYLSQSGLEYAMRKVYEGTSPVTGVIPFGKGSFQIIRAGSVLTATGWAGDAQVAHNITQPVQADCITIDTTGAYADKKTVRKISLTKTCLESLVLDKMTLSWDPNGGESYDRVQGSGFSNEHLYDGPPRVKSGETAELADTPMKKNDKYKLEEIRFGTEMKTKAFQLNLLMGDGSIEEVHFTLPP